MLSGCKDGGESAIISKESGHKSRGGALLNVLPIALRLKACTKKSIARIEQLPCR